MDIRSTVIFTMILIFVSLLIGKYILIEPIQESHSPQRQIERILAPVNSQLYAEWE